MLATMTIASRLMVGFGLLVIIIAGLSGFSVYSARDMRGVFANVVQLKTDEVLNQRAQKGIAEARIAVWMALATNDQADWAHADAAFKLARERLAELLAGTTGRTPGTVISGRAVSLFLAIGEQLVHRRLLDLHGVEPADTKHFGQSARVAAVRLVGPHRQHRLRVPGVEANDR